HGPCLLDVALSAFVPDAGSVPGVAGALACSVGAHAAVEVAGGAAGRVGGHGGHCGLAGAGDLPGAWGGPRRRWTAGPSVGVVVGQVCPAGGGSGVAAVDFVAEPVGVVGAVLGHRLAAPVVTDVDQPEAGVALLPESFGGHVGEVFGTGHGGLLRRRGRRRAAGRGRRRGSRRGRARRRWPGRLCGPAWCRRPAEWGRGPRSARSRSRLSLLRLAGGGRLGGLGPPAARRLVGGLLPLQLGVGGLGLPLPAECHDGALLSRDRGGTRGGRNAWQRAAAPELYGQRPQQFARTAKISTAKNRKLPDGRHPSPRASSCTSRTPSPAAGASPP